MNVGKAASAAGLVLALLVAGSSPAALAVYYRYADEPTWDGVNTDELSCLAFLYDEQDVAHFFVALKGETDDVLVHYTHDGEFQGPEELLTMPGGASNLTVVESPDGSFCLLWQGRDAAINRLFFIRVCMGEVGPLVEIATGGLLHVEYPALAVDSSSQAHIAFAVGERTMGYSRMLNGVFEPTRFLALLPNQGAWIRPIDLTVAPDGVVYFASYISSACYAFRFDGARFSYPIRVCSLYAWWAPREDHPWILVDSAGTLHLLFNARHERAAGFTEIEGTYVKGTLEGGFGPPQAIDHDEWAYLWRRPVLDDQGVLHAAGTTIFHDDLGIPFLHCYHFYDTGLGFGNFREGGIFGQLPPDGDWVFFDVKHDGSLGFAYDWVSPGLREYPLESDTLEADLSVGQRDVSYEDVILLDLNLYNPGPAVLHASLEIRLEALVTWPDYPLYLTADPVYPTFTTEPSSFLFDLGPGEGLQHLPLLWIDLSVAGRYGLPDFDGVFLLTLRDMTSGQMLCLDTAGFWFHPG